MGLLGFSFSPQSKPSGKQGGKKDWSLPWGQSVLEKQGVVRHPGPQEDPRAGVERQVMGSRASCP